MYTEESKMENDTYIPLFIAALFTIARAWKQRGCPLTDEWIKNLWYLYTMEYYSATKRNTFESVLLRRMNLEHIIQSEVSQREKDKWRRQWQPTPVHLPGKSYGRRNLVGCSPWGR